MFDTVMRGVFEGDPVAACGLLGIEITTTSGAPEVLPASFPAVTKSADLLLRVGPGRLAHIEYARQATSDLVPRMLGYRSLIMLAHLGEQLTQYIVVLGGGRVRGHDDPTTQRFWLDLKVLYLRELDPAACLADAALAPLAALGRGSPAARAEAYAQALRVVYKEGGPRTGELLAFTTVLATITVDAIIMKKIVEEVGMTVEDTTEFFRGLAWGQTLLEQGLEQGLERGLEQGLVARLQERFGTAAEIPAIAHQLARWPDPASAYRAITAAAALTDLADAQPPRT
ncbi:MAG TPA: hypothetical protein VLL08_21380 [Kineosporiaceae bacterium]|nr:hypothetical protein [Kineosporiaceae bacterium]